MSENAWRARILRVVRERKKLNNSTSAVSFGERPTRGPSYTCALSLVQPAARADYSKKSYASWCVAIFSVPLFDSKKNSFVQKVSKSFKKFRLFKFRRVPISVYTEIPLLLGSSLDVSEKVVTARHGLISFWQNEFSAHPNLLIFRNVIQWGSQWVHVMTACQGYRFCRHNFSPVNISFTFLISPASGIKISRQIRIFNPKLLLGKHFHPSYWRAHLTLSDPVSIR